MHQFVVAQSHCLPYFDFALVCLHIGAQQISREDEARLWHVVPMQGLLANVPTHSYMAGERYEIMQAHSLA